MEGYAHLTEVMSNSGNNNNNNSRGGFVYGAGGAPVLAPSTSSLQFPGRALAGSGGGDSLRHLAFGGFGVCLDQSQHHAVKTEAGSSYTNNNNKFHYGASSVMAAAANQRQLGEVLEVDAVKAKIIAHPQYSSLLEAYMDCHKVGAPPEVVARLAQVRQDFETWQRGANREHDGDSKDPELDQFMEAYYDMLIKYREELTRPLQEAMDFMRRVEMQLSMLTTAPTRAFNSDDNSGGGGGSSDDDQEASGGGGEAGGMPAIDPRAEDRELKNHLLKKYSGYLSSLKQELSKKKKKGKLPKESRQKLLSWWELHYKWPYPSESEKVALAEATGLDQKQINNWFINQRKRHWKPSEDMQFMVMDGLHHPHNPTLYMEGHYMGEGPYRLAP